MQILSVKKKEEEKHTKGPLNVSAKVLVGEDKRIYAQTLSSIKINANKWSDEVLPNKRRKYDDHLGVQNHAET